MPSISEELARFLQSGISVLTGTRDAHNVPDATRGIGVRVEAGGDEATVFLPEATSATAQANLRDNGQVAVCFSRAMDHRSMQVKGELVELRPADERDRAFMERYREELAEEWGFVGLPPSVTYRMNTWPALAVRFRVTAVFVQTPGPGAGAPLPAQAVP